MKPIVSIIVPVYNVEKYVSKCLDSLINQTLKEIEIIVVNDGSTDNSKQICEEYAKKDERIVVYSKPNGGLSDARNFGLKHTTAEYIGFVDSDDYVDKNFFEELYLLAKNNNVKVSVAAIKRVDENDNIYREDILKNDSILSANMAIKSMLNPRGISNAVWNKLFHSSLLENEVFPVGKLYEDEFFTYRILDKVEKICVTSKASYYYKINPHSITHGTFSEREFDRVEASLIRIDYLKKRHPDLVSDAKKYLVWDCLNILSKMSSYDNKYNKNILKNIRYGLFDYIFSTSSISGKVFAIVSAISPYGAVKLYGFIKD